jgi:hypothetical protein
LMILIMDCENIMIISPLLALMVVYLYLLFSPSQPRPLSHLPNVVIERDSLERFQAFMKEVKELQGGYSSFGGGSYNYTSSEEWGGRKHRDDFFLDGFQDDKYRPEGNENRYADKYEPLVPSTDVMCKKAWIMMRSEMNYKYLWMHATETMWLGASATMDTPLHRKTFITHPVRDDCSDGGWVLMQEGDSDQFIFMVNPNRTESYSSDAWTVKLGTNNLLLAFSDPAYHFIIENDGFIINKDLNACVNVMAESDYVVRGHSNGWNKNQPAGREFGAAVHFQEINETDIQASIEQERLEEKEAYDDDQKLIQQIAQFPINTHEKRVISFGLYGGKAKYTLGAIHNVQLAKLYFPGWICRFYITEDVPLDVRGNLTSLGAEIESIPTGMGYTSGMFWRFMVASDPTVDRYIVRDTDSRLNARDAIAVQEWIISKYPVHILRDHVNHCIVMNGGMWGGIKGAFPHMDKSILAWENKNEYMADLHFLADVIWPEIKDKQLAHDSYCCDRYPHTKPFPTKRPMTYQHVGQVFDEFDRPRLTDIDGFIRGVPIPSSCRKEPEWIYG